MADPVDYAPEPDLDAVADYAAELGIRIRDEDPYAIYGQLVALCAKRPAKAAQVLMTFAAWFDPWTPRSALVSRAEAITGRRTA